ncbi:MAG: hypothetical protein HN657_05295 [Candidatus Marinimicrobia bacterium]|jgi:hypothetical protein|nr:hypothetical protein [Candidatus Neomarinimicrobiota bacterium]MBT3496396.1 hypothetical protein [Candidatus Neomarinimicrobiota bacterium]MBT3692635.1 hypothetical protein [Candidatus Neomarinimicrobiota bacterium]MBT3731569.1 hypothetical protein [Candidatus Neomarinimicrobiota bacterium]MBT4145137.1 hypothetical protein [Candidatus Neomarinimicrobiota bacterium]
MKITTIIKGLISISLVTLFVFNATACSKKKDKNATETKNEHPSNEHPSGEHPSGEHPSDK